MTWYEQWFNRDEYDLVYRNRNNREATRLVDLIIEHCSLPPGASILDVGCGRGRHALDFARRGYRVTGMDLSERALEVARNRAEKEELDIMFERGDMRDPFRRSAFDLVVNLFTAFGYFETDSDHQKVVDAFATAIKSNGAVVQDFLNAPYVRKSYIPEDRRVIDGVEIIQQRRVEGGRIVKEITLVGSEETHSFFESVALLDLENLETLYRAAGLRIVSTFGDYEGAPLTEDSPRLILIARPESSF